MHGEPKSTGAAPARRRSVLRALAAGGAGLAAGAAATGAAMAGSDEDASPPSAPGTPLSGRWHPPSGHVDVTWAVNTKEKLVALTFDDGPMPKWTPMVLDILDAEKAKATFFVVGERLIRNARLVHGRWDRHEIGSHTWSHKDLARLDYDDAHEQLRRAHAAIQRVAGKPPRRLRPPYGNVGGTTLQAASAFGYDLTLWSLKMMEKTYEKRPAGLIDYIVTNTRPGTILLAHDTGNPDRLVALNNLAAMIRGLRAKGFEFVTVSELHAAAAAPSTAPPDG